MSPELATVLILLGLLVGVLSGYPIFFVMAGLAAGFGMISLGLPIFTIFALRTVEIMQNFLLLAVPLFIFMGAMLESSGIADRMFGSMHVIAGRFRGGLAVGVVVISTLLAMTTGLPSTSVTMMGVTGLPAMLHRSYDKGLATGVVCAGGVLGVLIPPSILLVLFGVFANVSIVRLFAGAMIPGLLLAALYIIYIVVRCRLQPWLCPEVPVEDRTMPALAKARLGVTTILPTLVLIGAVLGSIFFGIATPTEAAGIGALAAILMALFYRQLNLRTLTAAVDTTLRTTSAIMVVTLGAFFFFSVFFWFGGNQVVTEVILAAGLGNKWLILTLMMVVVFVLGMFLDWIAILLMVGSIMFPISNQLGFDPIWFTLMVSVNLQMSFLTPPFAYGIFYLKAVAPPSVATMDIIRGVLPFVGLQALALLLLTIFPELITWFPTLVYGPSPR